MLNTPGQEFYNQESRDELTQTLEILKHLSSKEGISGAELGVLLNFSKANQLVFNNPTINEVTYYGEVSIKLEEGSLVITSGDGSIVEVGNDSRISTNRSLAAGKKNTEDTALPKTGEKFLEPSLHNRIYGNEVTNIDDIKSLINALAKVINSKFEQSQDNTLEKTEARIQRDSLGDYLTMIEDRVSQGVQAGIQMVPELNEAGILVLNFNIPETDFQKGKNKPKLPSSVFSREINIYAADGNMVFRYNDGRIYLSVEVPKEAIDYILSIVYKHI